MFSFWIDNRVFNNRIIEAKTMNLINEIDETVRLLENKIPANPASEKNESIQKRMQKSLAQYFQNIDRAIDWNTLEQIYYRNVKQE